MTTSSSHHLPVVNGELPRSTIVRWHQGVLNGTMKAVQLQEILGEDLAHGLEALWRLPLPPLPVVHWRSERQAIPSRCMLLVRPNVAALVWQARIAHDELAPWQVDLVREEPSLSTQAQVCVAVLASALDAMKTAFEHIPPHRRDKAFGQAGQAALLRGPCWSLLSGQVTGAQLLRPQALVEPGLR